MTIRWEYQLGERPGETERRLDLEALVAAWWSAFERKSGALVDHFEGRTQWDLPQWMSETLNAIDAELMWEFGPALETKGHRLVITPEARRDLRPLVRYILSRAPRLEGWEFYAHRLPESLKMARQTVEARCGKSSALSEVAVSLGEHHAIALRFSGPAVHRDEDFAQREAFVLTETLLGEELLNRWIGEISVHPRPKRGFLQLLGRARPEPESRPLETLQAKVAELILGVQGGLRDIVTASEADPWTLLELEPEKQDDYPWQQDLFVAKTPNLELWRATRADGFYDERFGRSGETFCYLKLDGSQGLDKEKFADKSEIEDALDALLKPAGWGCQIGGGTGLRYSYVELALKHRESALPAVRDLLARGNVPRRSWILFHNCELEHEWVGVYDDSPPPP